MPNESATSPKGRGNGVERVAVVWVAPSNPTNEPIKHSSIMEHIKQIWGIILYRITNGRVITATTAEKVREHRKAWKEHCETIQGELDKERQRGWGFRYIDGKRVDFS